MSKERRKFADDGWAVWIDGDDTSTVYINDWINPKGTSYVDFSVKIIGAKASKSLNVYVPFSITREEIEDISLKFKDKKTIQAVFSVSCILDFMKNEHTSEVAYNGKLVDIVHISTLDYKIKPISNGTLIKIDFEPLYQYFDEQPHELSLLHDRDVWCI